MRRLAALLLALLTAVSIGSPDAAAAPGLTLKIQPVLRSLRLGEDIALMVTVDNPTLDPVEIAQPRLASDATTVRVRAAGMQPAHVTRLYGQFAEVEEGLEFRTAETRRVTVPAGGRVTRELSFAAVARGTLELTATMPCADGTELRSEPIEVEVTTPGNDERLLARIETSAGDFVLALDGTRAFNAVSHFWSLARSGFYGNLAMHRIVPGTLVQTGDPRGDGTGTAGWFLPSEAESASPARGEAGLARGAHVDSASSQWFVALSGDESLAGAYTPLGKVVEGLDVLDAMAKSPETTSERPRVLSVRTTVR